MDASLRWHDGRELHESGKLLKTGRSGSLLPLRAPWKPIIAVIYCIALAALLPFATLLAVCTTGDCI